MFKNDIYICFSDGEDVKFSKKILSKKDKRKLKCSPNLKTNSSFITSRFLKNKAKKAKFSLSHKEKFAVVAFGKVRKLGVDMEILHKRDIDGVMDFCFNEFECELVKKADEKLQIFYQIYTLKEAVLKAKKLGFEFLGRVGLSKDGLLDEKGRKMFYKSYMIDKFIISIAFRY
ncbi:4'-phosphopantetheinyl transferase family protein [Campylobacter geochelonis]|uniref:4'-phosphopantetheinyl transferase superfamily protein n=1 Tax=Campylobacter geochelonis TaxID=1780362 RepID=A0A128EGD7_9BACT|nr:4'-phosphopantetheinyl transferase superfamily protein [Campylobacter geochelonis]QKF71820.1 phosphopantetheinyl transferase family protein [Campylobacter geochelonis]CZE47462.1 4'-phosphopantetheinyl transferase superfamily protein [Campylobacter geochelonis]